VSHSIIFNSSIALSLLFTADLNENIGIFKAARTRLMNEIEALKSSSKNQTIRISQLEDLFLKMNKTDSNITAVPSTTTTAKNNLF